jgi:hypothetical protein
MKFKNEFPKSEVTIETIKKSGDLAKISQKSKIHYRDYKGYLDCVYHYTLIGDKAAWYSIKSEFKYDYLMNRVKPEYKGEFGRTLKVELKKIQY